MTWRSPRKLPVLKLNNSLQVMQYISFNDAVTEIVMENAWVVETIKGQFVQGPPTPDGGRIKYKWPVSIAMKKYVHVDFEHITPLDDVMAARQAILNRDSFTCMYCGEYGTTYDHVFPKSRGGENTWMNLVAACTDCNGLKADRTPEEAGMKLLREPFVPADDRFASVQRRIWKMLDKGELEMDED